MCDKQSAGKLSYEGFSNALHGSLQNSIKEEDIQLLFSYYDNKTLSGFIDYNNYVSQLFESKDNLTTCDKQ